MYLNVKCLLIKVSLVLSGCILIFLNRYFIIRDLCLRIFFVYYENGYILKNI